MKRFLDSRLAKLLALIGDDGDCRGRQPRRPRRRSDEKQLLDAGFKVLVATNKVQEEWVQGLPPGKIRPMQRTGKKYFIYPDAAKKQVYVGGPKEYDAYVQLHPEHRAASAGQAAKEASAYRGKQDDVMRSATARDLSDPFLGASWADLGW